MGQVGGMRGAPLTEEQATLQAGRDANVLLQSAEILGILKQLRDEMQADRQEAIDAEEKAKKEFEELVAAKEKEIEAATKAIEDKLQRIGDLGVEIVNLKNDLEETT